MPVRLRIMFLFALLVFFILGVVCTATYYFSYTSRINTIKIRLANRAITTARLLSQRELFDLELVKRIDSSTTISLKNKAVQAYDYKNRKIYNYSDLPGDTLSISTDVLDDARVNGNLFFTVGDKEAVAYHYTDSNNRIVIISAAEDEDGKKVLNTLLNILLLSFLLGISIALISGYIFSKSLLHPIKKIADDVTEISAQNLTRRISTGHVRDEWFYLSTTLNELLNRLQESFELQRRFISNASHELSTPLTSISSQLEVSLQRERDADAYRQVIQSIHQDVQHMGKLTQTLLEFAKASGNSGGLELSLIRIDEILLELPANVARTDASYSVSLAFDQLPDSEEGLLVYGSETLLFTAIKNITINACKYSENHQATIRLKTQNNWIQIFIEDNGIGIPQSQIEKIFQPFYRVEERHTSSGFGLGLSLAERIIKLHKGNIKVASTPGEGTVFIVELQSHS